MKSFKLAIGLCVLFLLPAIVSASESSGTIEFANKNALVCHSVDCVTPTPGIINFSPTGTAPVTIDDINGIDGVAWGNEIGWINFDPTGAEGVTINPSTGIISGKAWSQVSGWINFSVTGQSVKINQSGEFEGYAWSGGPYGGWIKFDCSFAGACVKTDWRPASVRAVTTHPPTGGPIGSTSDATDACPNLVGYQDSVPDNYAVDAGGLCLLKIDYCKNIPGDQLTIPSQYVLNGEGQCVAITDENKNELLPEQPASTTESGTGGTQSSTTQPQKDFCPNLFGIQSRIPTGFIISDTSCVPEELDYCPNIPGSQYTMPDDMKVSNDGQCIRMTKSEIKKYKAQQTLSSGETIEVLGYAFIPQAYRIPVVFPIIHRALMIGMFQVDVWSFIISILLIVLSIFGLKRKLETDLISGK